MRALIATLLVAGVLAALGYWLVGGRDSATVSDSPAPEETVSEATLQAALEPHRQALEATRRPVVRIELEDFPQDEPQTSKVGGSAWWPEAEAAPVGQDGEALVLSSGGVISRLAQIALDVPNHRAVELNLALRNSALSEFHPHGGRLRLGSWNALPHLHGQRELWTYY